MNRNPQGNSDNNTNHKNKKKYQKIPPEVSAELRIIHQKFGVQLKGLLKQYPLYPKTSIYRYSLKPLVKLKYKRKFGKGRSRKLTDRHERSVI